MNDVVYDAELRIPGDLIYLRPVRAFVRELTENIGFCHQRVNSVEVAVDEVFSNAIEHGSAGPESLVVIRFLLNDEMLRIIISDTGRGKGSNVRWSNAWADAVREKTRPDTERGHGLLLVHSLTDEVRMESNLMGGLDVHLVVYRGNSE